MNPFPKEYVAINIKNDSPKAQKTRDLLLEVYNGTTHLKTIESSHIRTKLLKEIMIFQSLLCDFYETFANMDEERNACKEKIKAHLDRSSNFTAFKRWIIRDSAEKMADFGEYLAM